MRIARGFSFVSALGLVGLGTMLAREARAQDQPLPPLPSQQPQYAPPPQQQYPQQQQPYYQQQPPPQYYQQQPPPPVYYQPPPQYYGGPQGAYAPEPPEPPTHAPKFALWTGARLGYLGFGGGFYGLDVGDPTGTHTETTGNLVSNGATVQLDVGARLGRRYVPFVFYEHSFLHPGHRLEQNNNSSAYAELYGVGFRYTAGDVDTAGFLTEISIGQRTVAVSDGTNTYKLQALEFFKLGLGAEIRLSTLFVLSPLASISTGAMTDTTGTVSYTNSITDSLGNKSSAPPFKNGDPVNDQRGYVMVSLTVGAHFDVFGK